MLVMEDWSLSRLPPDVAGAGWTLLLSDKTHVKHGPLLLPQPVKTLWIWYGDMINPVE